MNAMLDGVCVVVEALRPRYALPADVPPPAGMTRDDFSAWSARVCGYQAPIIPFGEMIVVGGKTVHMNQRTYERLTGQLQAEKGVGEA